MPRKTREEFCPREDERRERLRLGASRGALGVVRGPLGPFALGAPAGALIALGLVTLGLVGVACTAGDGDGPAAECASSSDCGDVESVCDRCPPLGEALCLEGACEARADDAVDVTATVNIEPRQLVVTSLVHALVSTTTADGTLDCASAVSSSGFASSLNALAVGTKALSGGSFHEDVSVGRVPEGEVALVLLGTDGAGGSGDIIATGCLAPLSATGGALDAGVVSLTGL